ncbi:drug/metabolite transporter (DMT)-like permease [Mucilaginibacter lappiensis]|uniref:Drug/metabolite transporter (DMT)-like permease n=1 Tax=Mucilaginibacter lappiensis TaxID=354630 RepID=A0ABR6PPI2_9SPHI|nr:EamA family transporter [Mucilaginibacter lappiensis]MBB6111680.1 drug/metabolite transporter (DMT)-like permease [Mucilaginibacter lappiensis]
MNKYMFMVFAGACSYGILSTFVKLAYQAGYTIEELSVTQASIGFIVLTTLTLIQGYYKKPEAMSIPVSAWLYLLLTGACIGMTSYVYYLSVKYIPASVAIVLLMQFTWIGILLEWLFFNKKPAAIQFIIIGIIWIATIIASGVQGTQNSHLPAMGICYGLLSAVFYAVFILINSRLKYAVSSLMKSSVMIMGSAISLIIFTGHQLLAVHHFNIQLLKWGMFLALFGTIIPPLLFASGIPKTGHFKSSVLMTVEFPVAMCCSWFFLGEHISLLQWIGVIAMLMAIVGIKRKSA